MADIQSAAAQIRRGKEKRRRKNKPQHALTYNISAVSVIALYFSDCNNTALRRFLECMPALIAISSVVCAQSHAHIYTSPLLTARSLELSHKNRTQSQWSERSRAGRALMDSQKFLNSLITGRTAVTVTSTYSQLRTSSVYIEHCLEFVIVEVIGFAAALCVTAGRS